MLLALFPIGALQEVIGKMDEELKAAFAAIHADLEQARGDAEQFRAETTTNFQAVRSQLNTIEFGVLTIAQKLLAESEVRELQSRMRRKAS
jgi:hypothetical protein